MIRPGIFCSSWPVKPLNEAVEFLDHIRKPITAKDRIAGPYPYYGANGQQDSVVDYLFDEPLILIAEDGGHFGEPDRTIAYRIDGKCWVNNHAHVLRPRDGVDIGFLCRQLEKYDVTPFISGTTRAKLTKGTLSKLPVTLPPLAKQKRIAAILDKADAIRKKRRQAIALSEDFLHSAFLEMFGDPVTNPKGWEVKTLRAISIRFSDGPFGSNLKSSHYVKSGVRVIRLQNIAVGEFVDKAKAYISEKHFTSLRKHECLPGDVIIGTMGDPNLRACILPDHIEFALNKADCIQMRIDQKVCTPEFVVYLLNHPGTLALVSHMLHGQTRVRVSMGTLRELAVPIPDVRLQKKFSALVISSREMRVKQERSEGYVNDKFNSLVQRAFRGEL